MHHRTFALLFTLILPLMFGPMAAAQSAKPAGTPAPKSVKAPRARSLGHLGIHGRSTNGPVSAASCNGRAAVMPGSNGTLGPNGASRSQTVVAVPLGAGSGDTAAATRRQQIDDACAKRR